MHLAAAVGRAFEPEEGLAFLEEIEGGIDLPLLIEKLAAGEDFGGAEGGEEVQQLLVCDVGGCFGVRVPVAGEDHLG